MERIRPGRGQLGLFPLPPLAAAGGGAAYRPLARHLVAPLSRPLLASDTPTENNINKIKLL